jgi:hypothetical protein
MPHPVSQENPLGRRVLPRACMHHWPAHRRKLEATELLTPTLAPSLAVRLVDLDLG